MTTDVLPTENLMADPPADGGTPDGQPQGDAGAKPAEGAAKPTDPPKPGDGQQKQDDKPAAKAPEKYEFKAPEGFELDTEMLTKFDPVLRELDLSQEQAQKLIDFAPEFIGKHVQAAAEATYSKVLKDLGYEAVRDWVGQAKADKEFGGDKLQENLAVINRARDQFASPELIQMLKSTPLGNNPEMLRLFYRIGKQITPDGYMPGGKTASTSNDAQRLYDASQMNP